MKRCKRIDHLASRFFDDVIDISQSGDRYRNRIHRPAQWSGCRVCSGLHCVTGLDMAIKDLNTAEGITFDGQMLLIRL